tara:strand:- start:314 stop:1171 length:858 start_codon:yes stop_codon:yes gene_type:complete
MTEHNHDEQKPAERSIPYGSVGHTLILIFFINIIPLFYLILLAGDLDDIQNWSIDFGLYLDESLWQSIMLTYSTILVVVPLSLLISMILVLLLDRNRWYADLLSWFLEWPIILSGSVVASIWLLLFSYLLDYKWVMPGALAASDLWVPFLSFSMIMLWKAISLSFLIFHISILRTPIALRHQGLILGLSIKDRYHNMLLPAAKGAWFVAVIAIAIIVTIAFPESLIVYGTENIGSGWKEPLILRSWNLWRNGYIAESAVTLQVTILSLLFFVALMKLVQKIFRLG